MKIIIRKITSRKFILALAGIFTGIAMALKVDSTDIKRKQDKQDEQYMRMAERVIAVEASAKQAYKRIDEHLAG